MEMACMCEVVEIEDGFDGFFYHKQCGLQVDELRSTEVESVEPLLLTKEDFKDSVRRKVNDPKTHSKPRPKFWVTLEDEADFSYPDDLPNDYYFTEIRKTYVMGIQMMIQLQIKALVEDFKACPIIIDMIEPVWLRIVDSTQVFSNEWANETIKDTKKAIKDTVKSNGEDIKIEDGAHKGKDIEIEDGAQKGEDIKTEDGAQKVKDLKFKKGAHKGEPCTSLYKRGVMLWYRSLSNKIPLSYSIAISFLACHLAREPILSIDILKWALEGKLPYFNAFTEINKLLQLPTVACPLTSTQMFRPTEVIPIQKLEALAASIAQSIGLELPPVNFSAIASRYLKHLSLPINIILPYACRIYEWSMPPELWFSASEFRLPTYAFVLSILVVSIRILYNIHGFGKWEKSLSCCLKENSVDDMSPGCSSQSEVDDDSPCNKDLDATMILVLLQSKHNELIDASEHSHSKDLETYLEYCEKVVFVEDEKKMKRLSYVNQERDEIMKDFFQFYKDKKEDHKPSESCFLRLSGPHKRPQDHLQSNMKKTKKPKKEITLDPIESHKDREIREMKSNMQENKFCYIPPRKRVQKHDYVHYTRKKRVVRMFMLHTQIITFYYARVHEWLKSM